MAKRKNFICWWKGHYFMRIPDKKNLIRCKRCGQLAAAFVIFKRNLVYREIYDESILRH
jgi:hypothetical protein